MYKRKLQIFILTALFGLIAGACATIVGERTQLIPINSSPDGADVVISDEKGMKVLKGKTPLSVTLKKSDGSYFGGKTYSVKISKDGFESQVATIKSTPNGWYIVGNLVFGGLIGWLIVDPLTGAMYNLTPEQVQGVLGEKTTNAGPPGLNIALIEEVPRPLLSQMKRVN